MCSRCLTSALTSVLHTRLLLSTMEGGTRSSLLWFLLLNQLTFCLTNETSSTMKPSEGTITSGTSTLMTSLPSNDTNICPVVDCLIDTEMGLIAIGSAGGLIMCLLVATVVLACQVCQLQRRVNAPRTSRSNLDLVSGTGYWGTDLPEVEGLVGPCDASVMLEEVRADSRMEEDRQPEIEEPYEGAEAGFEEGATAMAFDPEEKASQMQSSSSRDSCLEIPRDLENMPLVV
ncbi:uncharacterized protein LOC133979932 [Scomber scombrus]|uniref:uncharacterized protein LOC133979932 n=1 Tax=Scomber scombrus TaxID=13677 RepID=UPI002DD9030B|nr:uncharacterized protein LOC133979932 [Scomber scombrus]